jgi:FixJ family two-component response regulator
MSNTALVYVVDDDASVREGAGSLIRSAGLQAETFASAQEFLASPRAEVPSCLVLDVKLPGLSGLDLQQELAKADVQIPIVFLTGHGDIPMTVRAIKAGAQEFLTKPCDDEALLDAIHRGIASYDSSPRRAEAQLLSANARLQKRQMEIEEDLRLAARIQKSLEPKALVSDTISIDCFYHPLHSVGGDFARVISDDHEHVNLLVCDVSGHGIGSALVANRIYAETTAHLRSGMPFTDMFAQLNRFLIEDIDSYGLFVTLAAARIDTHHRRMVFAGAGHPPAMLARRGQNPLLLESRSIVLGMLPDAVDATTSLEVQLEPDDRIVLYTDGISEAFNSRGQMLDISGVQEIVRQTSFLPAEEMKQGILDGVAAWRNGPPTDDVSLVLAHVR